MNDMRALWHPHTKPRECTGCPYAASGRGFVPGVGDLEAPLIFAVFEKPGENEIKEGMPLVGMTGKKVENALTGWDRVYRTNVRKCLAPDRGRTDAAKRDRIKAVQHCSNAYLQAEIDYLNKLGTIKTTMLGGADAARTFFGLADMQKYHSSVWTREEVDAIRSVHRSTRGGADVERGDVDSIEAQGDTVVSEAEGSAEDSV